MTINGGEATGRDSKGSHRSNAAVLESASAHSSLHAERLTQLTL